MTRKRIFIYVQHLLGIGHLRRAVALARAASGAGLEVTLASGGFPVRGTDLGPVRFVQLPPAGTADQTFKALVDADGNPVGEEWKARRREALLQSWRECDPHVLVIELYPFGRRQMRFELLPLLDAATGAARRPVIVSSVRDVLGGGQKDPTRQDAMLEAFERHFDRLLVHGDPALIPFGMTFRHADRLAGRLHYTGYVVDRAGTTMQAGTDAGEGEVLVSAGGGAVGRLLLETAIRSRALTALAGRTWRVLAGVNVMKSEFDMLSRLAREAGDGRVVVERSRPDFSRMLRNCELSISQGGYNTVMELLEAGTRAVVVPFAGGSEIEQTLRTRLLAERGLVDMVAESALTPEAIAAAAARAMNRPRGVGAGIDLDGAARSAELLAGWAEEGPC